MVKEVGLVTSNQFGYIYINGVPYNPAKVRRFVTKGSGIRLGDFVVFEADGDRILSYIKNAKYSDGVERKMVKEFIRASEIKKGQPLDLSGVSDEIRRELAEEGVAITNDGLVKTPVVPGGSEGLVTVEPPPEEGIKVDIDPSLIKGLMQDQKRTLSILIQSSLKSAVDINILNTPDGQKVDTDKVKRDTLDLVFWIDRNSTQIFNYEPLASEKKETQKVF